MPKPDIGQKSRFLPQLGGSSYSRNIVITFSMKKTRMVWLFENEKKFEDTITRFDTVHERGGQTDGQTPHDDIGRAYA